MSNTHTELAEQTAINASKAVIALFDFAIAILEDVSRHVSATLDFHTGKSVHFASTEANLFDKFVKTRIQLPRFLYLRFFIGESHLGAAKAKSQHIPFVMASIINRENRPPGLIYGIINRDPAKTQEDDGPFLRPFLFWLNEDLNQIYLPSGDKRIYGHTLTKQLSSKGYFSKYSAKVSFQTEPLLAITRDSLPERADAIAEWFRKNVPTSD